MSTTNLATFASSSVSSTNTNDGRRQLLPSLPPPATQDNSTPMSTSTVRLSSPTQMGSDASNGDSISPGANVDGNRSMGSGMGTPFPSASAPFSPHAQATHSGYETLERPDIVGPESPSSSSIGPLIPPRSSEPHASRPSPSPPLPPPPQQQRPVQVVRSATSPAFPRQTRSSVTTPNWSTSATSNAYGTTYNSDGNTGRIGYRNGMERERMSSIATSMGKAGVLLDTDASRVFSADFGGIDRPGNMHRDSAIGMPVPFQTMNNRERDTRAALRSRMENGGGGGGDGGRGSGGNSLNRDSDSIGIPRLPRTVHERLQPTIDHAMHEEAKYARKAKLTGYALNAAIGLQVFLSALITALSAVTSGRRTQIMTSILGGAGTIVASYLARARGSNEPELSIARTKDLQRFVRTCDAFVQDHGLETGLEEGEEKEGGRDYRRAKELDTRIRDLRNELEHLLGNGDGERRLSPPV